MTITSYTLQQAKNQLSNPGTQIRLQKLANLPDDLIDTSEIKPLDENWFKKATAQKKPKSRITSYIDTDILDYLKQKAGGRGYQTYINSIIREYVSNNHL